MAKLVIPPILFSEEAQPLMPYSSIDITTQNVDYPYVPEGSTPRAAAWCTTASPQEGRRPPTLGRSTAGATA